MTPLAVAVIVVVVVVAAATAAAVVTGVVGDLKVILYTWAYYKCKTREKKNKEMMAYFGHAAWLPPCKYASNASNSAARLTTVQFFSTP